MILALTISIPDWLFHWPFWAGFGSGIVTVILLICFAFRNWSLF